MQDDFLELESLVLEGATLNVLADSIDGEVQVTGLKDVDGIELNDFSNSHPRNYLILQFCLTKLKFLKVMRVMHL